MPDASAKPDEFATIIGADAQFKGELSFQGGVRIDGQFEGSIQSSGRVLVSKTGKLKAEVKAGTAILEGQCDGNVGAEERVEIRATAQLRGDVRATKLLVAEGASWVGRCEVGPNVAASAPAAKPAMADGSPMRAIPAGIRH